MAHHGHRREEYEEDEERREEKHHHGHRHHDEEEQEERYTRREEEFVDERRPEVGYGRRTDTYEVTEGGGYGGGQYGGGQYGAPMTTHTTQVSEAEVRLDGIQQARTHETTYQRTEYAGVAGAALGAGLAMYEGHEAKIDPQNAARHRLEEEIAGGLGVGAAGVGLYGHHKKENSEEQLEELETGRKKHGWFG